MFFSLATHEHLQMGVLRSPRRFEKLLVKNVLCVPVMGRSLLKLIT